MMCQCVYSFFQQINKICLADVSENLTSGNTLLTSQTGPDLGRLVDII